LQFKDIIGQKETKLQLRNMVSQKRVSHALLMLGQEGSGTLPMALAFGQFLLCEKNRTAGSSLFEQEAGETPADSCGQCAACVKAAGFIHPDLHFSYPVISGKKSDRPSISADFAEEWRKFLKEQPYGNSYDWLQSLDAENKQGNITAQEINDIIRKMNLKSFEGSYKVLIMWLPEFMGQQGNKLLKLIEEPPADTIFILAAENESQILSTILSRTQLVRLRPLHPVEIEAALELREGAPAKRAQQVAAICHGNFREAMQQLKHADEDWEPLLREWMNSILKTGPAAQVKWIEEAGKLGREKQKQFLRYFLSMIEMAVRLRFLKPEEGVASQDHDFASKMNRFCGMEQLEAIGEELEKSIYHIERNANAKILFHALTIRLYHIISNKSVILV
jgi:DNA polymerase-3 subunit delta'